MVPYYHRWMAAFPTVADLAAADLETVLGHWSGLGYYARCRNLHRAAQAVARDHRGVVPRDPAALAALPGVGPYTLGAIRSIAFGDPVPLVDGNVIRVLSRLDALEGNPASGPVKAALWARAGALVETGGDPSALNQALMELGATVCTPTGPACLLCPVSASCLARRQGREAELPQVARRPRRRRERAFCAVATRADRVLLARRPATGLLGGLWEPPRVPEAAARAGRRLGTVTHVFTHIELKLEVFALEVAPAAGGRPPRPAATRRGAGCPEAASTPCPSRPWPGRSSPSPGSPPVTPGPDAGAGKHYGESYAQGPAAPSRRGQRWPPAVRRRRTTRSSRPFPSRRAAARSPRRRSSTRPTTRRTWAASPTPRSSRRAPCWRRRRRTSGPPSPAASPAPTTRRPPSRT